MYKKVLIPLDGSSLAECVLPHARAIAKGCGIQEIVLLRVVELPPTLGAEAIDYVALQDADQKAAHEYLAEMKQRLTAEGFSVSFHILPGRAAEVITEFARKNSVDLIAIATHGRSGISRWVFGSVADRVVRSSSIPLLLIRPEGCDSGI